MKDQWTDNRDLATSFGDYEGAKDLCRSNEEVEEYQTEKGEKP